MIDEPIEYEFFETFSERGAEEPQFDADEADQPEFAHGYLRGSRTLLVLVHDEERVAIACAAARVLQAPAKAPLLHITEADVSERAKGKVQPRDLVLAFLHFARERGYAGVWVSRRVHRLLSETPGETKLPSSGARSGGHEGQ